MKTYDTQLANKTGVHPNCLAINSTGAATPDGSEYIAEIINNANYGPMQAFMAWAAGGTNTSLSGTPGTPDGVIEAAGASQILEAIQKGNAVGPGMYVQRAVNDTPAVYGDRVLELLGQGVLIASYPDLDNASWIGGNTAAQVAAQAAGEKWYRSSDAAGLVGDASGPYLQLPLGNPSYEKQYVGVTGTPAVGEFQIVISIGSSTLVRAVAVLYQANNGAWRFRFNTAHTVPGVAYTGATVTVTGVVYKNIANFYQSVSFSTSNFGIDGYAHAVPGTATIVAANTSLSSIRYNFSGDVELESKPTWADDFTYDWYITY